MSPKGLWDDFKGFHLLHLCDRCVWGKKDNSRLRKGRPERKLSETLMCAKIIIQQCNTVVMEHFLILHLIVVFLHISCQEPCERLFNSIHTLQAKLRASLNIITGA